jgi:hypothetical protein
MNSRKALKIVPVLLMVFAITLPNVNSLNYHSLINTSMLCFYEYLESPQGLATQYSSGALIKFNGNVYSANSCIEYVTGNYKLDAILYTGFIFVKWDSSPNIKIQNAYNSSTTVTLFQQNLGKSYINLYIRKPWLYFYVYAITSTGYQHVSFAQISFNNANYNDGGLTIYTPGTYQIKAIYPTNFQYDHWSASNDIIVNNYYNPTTTATLKIQTIATDQFIALYIKGSVKGGTFNVTFTEQGLIGNSYWKVSISNITQTALAGQNIVFHLLYGTYQWNASSVTASDGIYFPNPANGTIVVNNNTKITIMYNKASSTSGGGGGGGLNYYVNGFLLLIDSNVNNYNLTSKNIFIGIPGEKVKFILYLSLNIPNNLLFNSKIINVSVINIILSSNQNAFLIEYNNNILQSNTIIFNNFILAINHYQAPVFIIKQLTTNSSVALGTSAGFYKLSLSFYVKITYFIKTIPLSIIIPIFLNTSFYIDYPQIKLDHSNYDGNKAILILQYYWFNLKYPIYNKSGLLNVILLPYGIEGKPIDNNGYVTVIINSSLVNLLAANFYGQIEVKGIYSDGSYLKYSDIYINYSTIAIGLNYVIKQNALNTISLQVVDFLNLKPISNATVEVIINNIIFGFFTSDNYGIITINYNGTIYSLSVALANVSSSYVLLPSQYTNTTLLLSSF